MTSRELMAALAKRYDITNPNLENLPDSILLAIQHEEHNTLSYKQAVVSLAHQAQIILEPLDTFAARAHDAIRAKAAPDEVSGIAMMARDLHAMLPNGYKGPLPTERYAPIELLEDVRSFLRDFGQGGDSPAHLMSFALHKLCARYSVPMAPLDTLAKRLSAHMDQMERDAAEAHSAAKALGVEVKDLTDVAKTMAKNASAVDGRAELWRSAAKNLNADLCEVRRMVGASVTDDIQAHMRDFIRQRDTFQANAVDALDRLAKVEAKLQAINEALPPDLRHSDDLAAAVRTLAERDEEVIPAVQTVAALRHALESPHLCLALARELYDADENLLTLLEDAHRPSLAETLMATLATNRAARTEYPPLPKPSALARTLEGPAKVAYFNHGRRAGRVEAIGEDLIRFYPVEGDPVTLNATRRDLEVYTISADELATQIARTEARKAPPAETPSTPRPPDVADDDLPF